MQIVFPWFIWGFYKSICLAFHMQWDSLFENKIVLAYILNTVIMI